MRSWSGRFCSVKYRASACQAVQSVTPSGVQAGDLDRTVLSAILSQPGLTSITAQWGLVHSPGE